jgi:anthranilate phosphoribosyltransferase
LVEPLAHVLKNLAAMPLDLPWRSGLMKLPTGATWISELKNGQISSFEVTPEAVGLKRSKLEDLRGGDAAQNAAALRAVLQGEKSAFRDAVVMTTGAALLMDNKAKNYAEGVRMAEKSIDNGSALASLEKLIKVSNS